MLYVARHHDTGAPMVVYRSHAKGTVNVRPLRGTATDPDGWLDPARNADRTEARARFRLVEKESQSAEEFEQGRREAWSDCTAAIVAWLTRPGFDVNNTTARQLRHGAVPYEEKP